MLNGISTLIMTGMLAVTGGTMNVDTANTAELVAPNAIVLQIDNAADEATDEERQAVREFFRTARVESAADLLGLTVAELEEAREAGTSLEELLENAGLTADEFKDGIESARETAVQEAIDTGLITQEQADAFAERAENENGRGRRGSGGNAEIVADILGVDAAELEAARENGTLDELISDAGFADEEAFREAVGEARQEAREARVEEALENGDITEEQAENILNGEGRGERGQRGERGTRGDRGNRGPNNQPEA